MHFSCGVECREKDIFRQRGRAGRKHETHRRVSSRKVVTRVKVERSFMEIEALGAKYDHDKAGKLVC